MELEITPVERHKLFYIFPRWTVAETFPALQIVILPMTNPLVIDQGLGLVTTSGCDQK
jgi:hypothetical protein